MSIVIPARLAHSCRDNADARFWLARLPFAIEEFSERWSLTLEPPIDSEEVSCSWVARATRRDGFRAVLKAAMPHMEGRDEIAALLLWDGNGSVRVLEHDREMNVMLIEACDPGAPLRTLPEEEQDVIIAKSLVRLWRLAPPTSDFRGLDELIAYWSAATLRSVESWTDDALVRQGLIMFRELAESTRARVVLATDLHAGNVLSAERAPWLVIDPKPFVGDPAFDATQHLLNCRKRLRLDPVGLIHRMADMLGVDRERVRRWTFARLAAEPRQDWSDIEMLELAWMLA